VLESEFTVTAYNGKNARTNCPTPTILTGTDPSKQSILKMKVEISSILVWREHFLATLNTKLHKLFLP